MVAVVLFIAAIVAVVDGVDVGVMVVDLVPVSLLMLLLLIPKTYFKNKFKLRSVTADILLTLSFCVVWVGDIK